MSLRFCFSLFYSLFAMNWTAFLFLGIVLLLPAVAQTAIEPLAVEPAPVENPVEVVEPGSELWDLAMYHYEQQNWALSYEKFAAYLTNYPQNGNVAEGRFRLGECAREFGDTQRARTHYEEVIRLHSGGNYVAASAYQLGIIHYLQENLEQAVQLFLLAREETQHPIVAVEANYLLGYCQEALGNTLSAIDAYEQILAAEELLGQEPAHKLDSHLSLVRLLQTHLQSLAEASVEPALSNLPEELKEEEAVKTSIYAHLQAVLDQKEQANSEQLGFAYLQRGLLSLQEQDHEAAIADFNQVLEYTQAAPQDRAAAQLGLIEAAYSQEQWQAVIQAYANQAISSEPSIAARMHLLAGNSYVQLEQPEQASAAYAEAGFVDPLGASGSEAGYRRLLLAHQANDVRLAILVDEYIASYYEVENSPWPDRARLIAGEFFLEIEDYPSAGLWLRSIQQTDHLYEPFRSGYLLKRAWLEIRMELYLEAFNTLEQLTENYSESPQIAEALVLHAHCARKLDKPNEAELDLKAVIERFPESPSAENAWRQLAEMFDEQEDFPQVIASLEALIEQFPHTQEDANIRAKLGQAFVDTEQYRKAIAHLEASARLDAAREVQAMSLVIGCYRELEDLAGTAQAVEAALAKHSNLPAAKQQFIWLGVRFFEAQDYAQSAKFLLLVDPSSLPQQRRSLLQLYLARALTHIGRYQEAVICFRLYLELEETPVQRAQALLERGQAYLHLGQPGDALRDAELGQQLVQEGRIAGQLHLLRGNAEEARENWQAAAESYITPAEFYVDAEITPRALAGMVRTSNALNKQDLAATYQAKLDENYPNWQEEPATAPIAAPADSPLLQIKWQQPDLEESESSEETEQPALEESESSEETEL